MNIPPWVKQLIVELAREAVRDLAKKAEVDDARNAVQKFLDFVQVQSGNVNLDGVDEAISKACATCLRDDMESQVQVAAYICALYFQHDIRRAAEVGGSLRKRFGSAWFPHIKERELRFAKDVSPDLEEALYGEIMERIKTADATPEDLSDAAGDLLSDHQRQVGTTASSGIAGLREILF